MKKVIRLTEADLYRIVKRVISEQPTTNLTVPSDVNFNLKLPGDNQYIYGFKDGKWYTKYLKDGKTANLSDNPKWKQSVERLKKVFGENPQLGPGKGIASTNIPNKPQTPSYTVPSDVNFNLKLPGDNQYIYGFKDGKWYTKYLKDGKTANLSDNPKWKQSVERLKKVFGENPQLGPGKGIASTNTLDFGPTLKIDLKPTDNSSSTPGMEEPELGLGGRMFK